MASTIHVADPEAMDRLGAKLASVLEAGDVVCVSGVLGAGKSHLCRAIVRTFLGDIGADVPSPSYTLVNVYAAGRVDVWHADLYRIADPSELAELGLEDALDEAVVLVEWPERWPDPPDRRLEVSIRVRDDESRTVLVNPVGPGWDRVVAMLEDM